MCNNYADVFYFDPNVYCISHTICTHILFSCGYIITYKFFNVIHMLMLQGCFTGTGMALVPKNWLRRILLKLPFDKRQQNIVNHESWVLILGIYNAIPCACFSKSSSHFNGLIQRRKNSNVLVMELLLFCLKPLLYPLRRPDRWWNSLNINQQLTIIPAIFSC